MKDEVADMRGYVATIGMFDGVHLGHQFVLRRLTGEALQRGLLPLCITFDHSPRQEPVLTPLDEKLRLIRQCGVQHVEVLPFTPELKALSARQFMEQVLQQRLRVQVLLTGYDNRFGHNREEGFDDYVRYGQQLGIAVLPLPAEGTVSSSAVRQQLLDGRIAEANNNLGRSYSITGRVVHGKHIGTRLGFPTANIAPEAPLQLIPANGVYAVTVSSARPATGALSSIQKGIMNIGTRPTFGQHDRTLEVHLLHYHADLYGQVLTVSFQQRLRAEQHFATPEALIAQLKNDAIKAEQQL